MLGITAICKEISLEQYEILVSIRLYHAIFLSTLLFNCKTWTKIKEYDIVTRALVQPKFLTQTLSVPYLTPNVVVYLQMRLFLTEYAIEIRRFQFLNYILLLANVKNL